MPMLQNTKMNLLIQVKSLVLRAVIDFGIIKKYTITLAVILPEPETEV